MNNINFIIAACDFVLAGLIFAQTQPSLRVDGVKCAFRLWLLAMAIGMFGVGRLSDYMDGATSPHMYTFGHFCLIAYATCRWLKSRSVHTFKERQFD